MIKFDEFGSVHLISWFPCVVTFRVPFSFDEVLEPSSSTMTSVVNNVLHFVLLFTIDQVRWWAREVGSVCCGFSIWRKEGGVEHVVYAP